MTALGLQHDSLPNLILSYHVVHGSGIALSNGSFAIASRDVPLCNISRFILDFQQTPRLTSPMDSTVLSRGLATRFKLILRGSGRAGGGEIESFTFNGNCIRNNAALQSLLTDVSGKQQVEQVCSCRHLNFSVSVFAVYVLTRDHTEGKKINSEIAFYFVALGGRFLS